MATIKSYTDIEQSRKLAEFLPLESADMFYSDIFIDEEHKYNPHYLETYGFKTFEDTKPKKSKHLNFLPCWSLAALLNVLPFPQLSKDKLGSGKVGWMVSIYPDNCRYDSCWHDNLVDACYEMILKLHKLKIL